MLILFRNSLIVPTFFIVTILFSIFLRPWYNCHTLGYVMVQNPTDEIWYRLFLLLLVFAQHSCDFVDENYQDILRLSQCI
jgi:hypothetical protein